jgi:hypothetical protein
MENVPSDTGTTELQEPLRSSVEREIGKLPSPVLHIARMAVQKLT